MSERTWPRAVRCEASALQSGGTVEALYSADLPNREAAHLECIVPLEAEATVCWDGPRALGAAWVRFRPGWTPAAWELGVRGADGVWRWQAGPAGEAVAVPLRGVRALGLGLRASQGAPGKQPLLRIRALAPQVAGAPPSAVAIERDGARHIPRLPLANDGNPLTSLDISDAEALWLSPPEPTRTVRLTVRQVGGSGTPAEVRRWLAAATVTPAAEVFVDDRQAGLAGGRVHAHLRFAEPVAQVRLSGPPRPRVVGLAAVAFGASVAGEAVAPAAIPPLADEHAPDAAAHPLHFAGTLKRAGAAAAAAVAGDGRLALPLGDGHTATLHVGFGVRGLPQARAMTPTGARLTWPEGVVTVRLGKALVVDLERPLAVGLLMADGLVPRPVAWRLADGALWAGDRQVARLEGAWTLRVGDEARLTPAGPGALHFPAGGPASPGPQVGSPTLPGLHGSHWLRAMAHAGQFDTGGALAYGIWPSVYHGDVFGLEEDYLAQAVGQWGDPARGLAWLRATYLTAAHLDPRHYLYDLRAGLTPWQVERALRRAGLGWQALTAGERAHLRACGAWTVAQRALTADADGLPNAQGVRVFPGCLPPARYGGDLGFATQPLYLSLLHAAGLRALGELTGEPQWAAEAQALRAAARAALAAVATPSAQPLHSGSGVPGADPGQYLQLMACGILMPVDVLPDDDPVHQRLEAQLVAEGRLFRELPRFDGWGEAPGIDAVYALGWLLRALRLGQRERFWRGLDGLVRWARCPDAGTWREVGPIRTAPRPPEPLIPGRRLSQSEPCLGSLGVYLQCLRHALVTPLPDADGRLTGRLRVGAGLLPEWRGQPLRAEGLGTLGGRVDLALDGAGWWIRAPDCAGLEVCDWSGRVVATLPPGEHRVPL
ncbi:MAG: hypothetical protein H6702_25150 [Myxococcales bacterium]|nr:hypothetical protein [Myxococcales bacterium]